MSTRENDFLNYYIRQNQVKLQLAQNMQRGRHSVFIGRRQDMVLPSIFFFKLMNVWCIFFYFLSLTQPIYSFIKATFQFICKKKSKPSNLFSPVKTLKYYPYKADSKSLYMNQIEKCINYSLFKKKKTEHVKSLPSIMILTKKMQLPSWNYYITIYK
jgi:hypothetical protein